MNAMNIEIIGMIVVVLLLAAAVGLAFFIGRKSGFSLGSAARAAIDAERHAQEQQAVQAQFFQHEKNLVEAHQQRMDAMQEQLFQLEKECALMLQRSQQQQEFLNNERQQFSESRKLLKQEFENLAHQIFEQKQQVFSEQSKQGLDLLLMPFKQQLDTFRLRVDEVHTQNVQGHSSLKVELDRLRQLNQQVTTEASNLTRALKGDKKMQGNWGEQKVELLLEQAGLRKGIEYEREKNFKDEDGNNRRPDFLLLLPEGKHIIIDSKVSLIDYSNYISAETDEARAQALAAHVAALRAHVAALAGKNYPELTGMSSPDFVFLFLAIEPAYMAALEHSPSLFQEAYEKRIAIVTSTTLLPVLRVVANLWGLQRQNQNTRELADQASGIYDKLRSFIEKMEKLGLQISGTHKTYVEAFNTLKDGRGNLVARVEKFIDLGVKVRQRLPNSVLNSDEDGTPVSLTSNIEEFINE